MLNYIWGMILIIFVLFLCDFVGYVTLKNHPQITIRIPIGALIFFGVFQILSLPFMVYHANFTIYKFFILTIGAIIFLLLFIKNKAYFQTIKANFTNKYNILVYSFSIIMGIILFLVALPLADSWLYGPMTLSCITNNYIFSNNGVENFGNILSFHYTDGYYLLQALIISLTKLDPYIAMMSIIKFFEGFLIVAMLGTLAQLIFKKTKIMLFIITATFLIVGNSFFTLYPQVEEIYGHTFQSVSMGINLFNCMGSILLFLIAFNNNNNDKSLWYLPIIVNTMFFTTSSSLFIVPAFLFSYTIYLLIINKDIDEDDYSLKTQLYAIVNGVLIVALYGCLYIFAKRVVILISLIIILIILSIVSKIIINKLKYKTINKIVLGLVILYLTFLIIGLLLSGNKFRFISNIINLDHQAIFAQGEVYYLNILGSIPFVILFGLGLYYLYKNNKRILLYIIINVILWANPLSYQIIGSIINKDVYHRVFYLFVPNIILMYGLYFVVYKYHNYLNKYIYIITVLVIVIAFFPTYKNIFSGFDSFAEYKYQNKDVYQLSQYNYPLTKNINFGVKKGQKIDSFIQVDNLLRTKGNLNMVDCTKKDKMYFILPKTIKLNLPYVYQSDNYYVYYDEKGDVCLINQ